MAASGLGSSIGGLVGSAYGQVGTVVGSVAGAAIGSLPSLIAGRQERANKERLRELEMQGLGMSDEEIARLRREQQTKINRAQSEAANQRNQLLASGGMSAGAVLPQAIALDEQRLALETLGGIEIEKLAQQAEDADRQELEDRLAFREAARKERLGAIAGIGQAGLQSALEVVDQGVTIDGRKGDALDERTLAAFAQEYDLDPELARELLTATQEGYDPARSLASEAMAPGPTARTPRAKGAALAREAEIGLSNATMLGGTTPLLPDEERALRAEQLRRAQLLRQLELDMLQADLDRAAEAL